MPPATADDRPALRAVARRANHPGFFFVNIGANDGVSNDPIYPFLCEYGWRGIAVEPLESRFEELARNYRRFPWVILERAAIADEPRAFHYIAPAGGYERTWTKQVGTLDRAFLLKTIDGMRTYEFDGPVPAELERSIVSVEVPCISFKALMEKHRISAVDFLNIDAEGADYEIFCSIDLGRYRPRILSIETGGMSDVERVDFERRLNEAGYVFLERLDFLTEAFVQQDLAPRRTLLRNAVRGVASGLRRRLRR